MNINPGINKGIYKNPNLLPQPFSHSWLGRGLFTWPFDEKMQRAVWGNKWYFTEACILTNHVRKNIHQISRQKKLSKLGKTYFIPQLNTLCVTRRVHHLQQCYKELLLSSISWSLVLISPVYWKLKFLTSGVLVFILQSIWKEKSWKQNPK